MDFDDVIILAFFNLLAVIFLIGAIQNCKTEKTIEIQEIKQVDNGYYVTINNEIYYKEVEK